MKASNQQSAFRGQPSGIFFSLLTSDFSLFVCFLFALGSISQLQAQVGNNNPTGPAGIFNGEVLTGCAYDPFTGTASRSTTEIVLPAVGEYPLALTRTSNSRAPSASAVFGPSGGWNHNYNWVLEDSPASATANFHPSGYTVDFPDGRVMTFRYSASDLYFRSTAGVRHRFHKLNLNTMLAYLILPDGGKVEFTAVQHSFQQGGTGTTYYYYRYRARAIIDPHGLRTTFTDEVTPNGNKRLQKVTEPAGRYLQFTYATVNGPRLSYVTASDGRMVQYYYTTISPGGTPYTALTSVVYYGNAAWTARYTYRSPNVAPTSGLPLLWTADDPMYPGPMKRMAYEYNGTTAVYGQILSERYWDGVAGHEASGAAVSTLEITGVTTRKETRGDNTWRTFTYSDTGYLTSNTDFNHVSASQTYDANKYINSVTDRKGNTTNFTSNALNGNMEVTTFPLTQGDTPGQTERPTVQYAYGSPSCADPNNRDTNNPYYVCTATDEGGTSRNFGATQTSASPASITPTAATRRLPTTHLDRC